MDSEPAAPAPEGPPGRAEGPPGDRLDGWKAIAGYLRRDIRTVQRWELNEHLPIHRLGHKQRSTAYAFSGELDEWMAKRVPHAGAEEDFVQTPVRHGRRWSTPALAVGLLTLVAVAAVALGSFGSGTRSSVDTADPAAYASFAEGSALYWARKYRDAAIALERAVSLDPSYGMAWAWLSKTYGRLSQPMWAGGKASSDRASETAERALRLAPGLAESHVAMALAARSTGDVKRWRDEAQRAIDLEPRSAEAFALLGDSYSAYLYTCNRNQDPALAESYYRRAMELKPNLITAASNRAHNLRRMGRYADCVELMNRTTKAFPDETPLIAERGACRLLAGDVAGAAEDIRPVRNNPKIAPAGALVYLGLLELRTGDTETGTRDLEAVLRLDQSARAELVVAETYGVAGNVDRAVIHLQRAFDLEPSCVAAVSRGVAFAPIRQTAAVESLLARMANR